jgi:hypothetical protein
MYAVTSLIYGLPEQRGYALVWWLDRVVAWYESRFMRVGGSGCYTAILCVKGIEELQPLVDAVSYCCVATMR